MGWNPIVIDGGDVPSVEVDDVAVANQADILRHAATKFGALAESLTRTWGDLANTYATGHTQMVLEKMDDVDEAATRAEWVYGEVAWALDAFAVEMRECRYEADALASAVRKLLRRDNVQVNASLPWTDEFEKNIACWQRAYRLRGSMNRAIEQCKVRLDAIGEDRNAFDPYDGLTSVNKDGVGFSDRVNVTTRDLDWDLFGTSGNVSGSQVDQGSLGDCWFLASLAALADKDPEAIRRMVHDDGDGNYTVTLFVDGRWQAIHVDNTMLIDENGRPRFAGDGDHNDKALWPMLVEKAAIRTYGGDYVAMNAGTGAMSMTLFTGNPAATDLITPNIPWDADAIAKYAEASQRADVIMTANSNVSADADPFEIDVTRLSGATIQGNAVQISGTADFYNNHVYQVASVAANGDVTLVNPHNGNGVKDGVDDDRFTITAEQFQDLFLGVSIGTTS